MQMPEITTDLVVALVADHFPDFRGYPVRPVTNSGWDNRMFHLGDGHAVRLPSGPDYALQVAKEHAFLPKLAPKLPLAIPTPVGLGKPSDRFPLPWSIYEWIPGESVFEAKPALMPLAKSLGCFLSALQATAPDPAAAHGAHSGFRGDHVRIWNDQFHTALERIEGKIDGLKARQIWQAAVDSTVMGAPVWVHGDVSPGNLLVSDGALSAVIDFGLLNVGDPACDMAIAWTWLDADSRDVFRDASGADAGVWARGKGWALWKAVIIEAGLVQSNAIEMTLAPRVLNELQLT